MASQATPSTAENIKNTAHAAIDAAEDKAIDGIDSAQQSAKQAVDKVADMEADVETTVKKHVQTVSDYINENPVQAAGFAFAAGVLTTILLSRR